MAKPCRPNLPHGAVKTVICGEHPAVVSYFEGEGTEVISAPHSGRLPEPVAKHADMLCCHCGVNRIVTSSGSLLETLARCGVNCSLSALEPENKYPGDIHLNCLVTDRFALGNIPRLDPVLRAYFAAENIPEISIRQGYARCSVAVVDENAFITADRSAARCLEQAGCDVLLISAGGILLPGYDTGFIGGCCGKLSRDKMLFCGDVLRHPDGQRIVDFLACRNVTPVCTHDGQLFDFGGFIPLFE